MDIMIPAATPDKNIDKNVFVLSFRFVLAITKPIRKLGIVCKTVLQLLNSTNYSYSTRWSWQYFSKVLQRKKVQKT